MGMFSTNERDRGRLRMGMSTARSNIQGGYYAAALVGLETFVDEGAAEAESTLGLLYAKGKGVEQDFEKSLSLFRSAAGKGDADGQYYLGYSYLEGSGIEVDRVMALAWFIQAAARGHETAIEERDKGFAALDVAGMANAVARAEALGVPLPSGWLPDAATNSAVWVPSRYRAGTYTVSIEAESHEGHAHGPGRAHLAAALPGDEDVLLEGTFWHGYLVVDGHFDYPFDMLEGDDYLIDLARHMPDDFGGKTLWLRKTFDEAGLALCPAGSPELLVAVSKRYPTHDRLVVGELARHAVSVVSELCGGLDSNAYATVRIVPEEHGRTFEDGRLAFTPLQARLSVADLGEPVAAWRIDMHDLDTEVEERRQRLEQERREKAERQAQKERNEREAAARGAPEIRGMRLGMSLAELHALFQDEIETWEPPWDPARKMPRYALFKQTCQLTDKANIVAEFSSAQTGSLLMGMDYSQTLRDGPSVAELKKNVEDKYGQAHETHGAGMYWNWVIPSVREGEVGAKMAARFKADRHTGLVGFFSIGFSDWGFARHDESLAHDTKMADKRKAAQAKEEANKSNQVKF
jgi:hypothetical protein